MKQKKRQNSKFINFVYFALAIFLLEASLFLAKSYIEPKLTMAETTKPIESIKINQETITFELPILVYHYIEHVTDERDTIRKSLNIEPRTFEAQIKTLKEAGYTFVTPNQIEKIESGRYKVQKPIIISFDDGYRDFYTDVFPILKKHNIKAVAFICPGLLDRPNYMNWDEVKEISLNGLIEIGSHSMNHKSLDTLDDKTAQWEIAQSKKLLEEKLDIKVQSFAYPYGHYSSQTPILISAAGYSNALTTDEGTNKDTNQKFTLKRIHPRVNIGSTLLTNL